MTRPTPLLASTPTTSPPTTSPATRPSLTASLADLVLPWRCVGCGADGAALCAACAPGPGALRTRRLRGGPTVVAAGAYDGGLRQALLGWKERGQVALRGPLGDALGTAVSAALRTGVGTSRPARGQVLLVPVPTSRSSRRARGGDLLAGLARRAGRRAGVRTATGALVLDRFVEDSAGLDRTQRRANLRGAFRARAAPPGAIALVVDDIVTTGTTLLEATAALRSAGWPVLAAAVVADTPLGGRAVVGPAGP